MIWSIMLSSSNWKTSRKPRFYFSRFSDSLQFGKPTVFGFMTVCNDETVKNNISLRECIQINEIPVKTGGEDFISDQNFLDQKFTIIFFVVSIELSLVTLIAMLSFNMTDKKVKPIIRNGHDSCWNVFKKCDRIQTNRNSIKSITITAKPK